MRRPITERELDQQDLRQVVELARARARREHNPDLGLLWADYLNQATMNAIRTEKRARQRAKPKGVRFVRIEGMRKPLEARTEFGGALVLFEAAALAMKSLTPSERQVVLLIFHLGMSREEAAVMMAKSSRDVGKLQDRALDRLRTVPMRDPFGS